MMYNEGATTLSQNHKGWNAGGQKPACGSHQGNETKLTRDDFTISLTLF
jgi:hypothetical protein